MVIAVKGRRNDVQWEIEDGVISPHYVYNIANDGNIVMVSVNKKDLIKHIALMNETSEEIS